MYSHSSIENNVGQFKTPGLGEYPDFLAFSLLILVTLMVSLGVKVRQISSLAHSCMSIISHFEW